MAKKPTVDKTIVHEKKIENIFSDSFARYAKYVIQDRALPDIRDGLKPVQRRIIHAMNELQIFHNGSYKKSARTVGEVIGKYHPHGDSSIYEAMVRMSQNWKNNIPLIDMHGNNGSIDNDPAAAMRYTEARLSLYAETMIKYIKKDTVPFIENFDGSESEPTILPSLLPNLLINGASGIAAGYATNIPPFNITELLDSLIKRIDSPDCYVETINRILPGPDFPTGGIILGKENMKEVYETGRGKIFIRAKIDLVSKKQAFITEIPYEVNKSDLIDEINECADKYDVLNITECHDETDQNGISICINFKNTDNFEFVKNFLFKNTSLQISYNFNMIAIKDKKPCAVGILTYLDSFISHCETIILNATHYDLDKAERRKEVVEGLLNAIKIVDQVIQLIRKSENKQNAKQQLMTQFKFSEIQAESIVTLQLYRLSHFDVASLQEEKDKLISLINEYRQIINDKQYRNNHIKNIFKEYKKMFKCKRRTQFSDEQAQINIEQNQIVEDKEVYIVVTKDGYIKNVSPRSFDASKYEEIGLKEADAQIFQSKTSQKNKLILFTSKGKYLITPIHTIEQTKWKDIGVHINSIAVLDGDEHIIGALVTDGVAKPNQNLIIATKNNMIKRTNIEDIISSRVNKISIMMKLQDNDEVINVIEDFTTAEENNNIVVVTNKGNAITYPINQISIVGKSASGVKNINTNEKIAAIALANKELLVVGTTSGYKVIYTNNISLGKRVGKPKQFLLLNSAEVINAFGILTNEQFVVLYNNNKIQYITVNEKMVNEIDGIFKAQRSNKIAKIYYLNNIN